eukprot:PhM_4_TR4607/c0_g1_i1/m.39167
MSDVKVADITTTDHHNHSPQISGVVVLQDPSKDLRARSNSCTSATSPSPHHRRPYLVRPTIEKHCTRVRAYVRVHSKVLTTPQNEEEVEVEVEEEGGCVARQCVSPPPVEKVVAHEEDVDAEVEPRIFRMGSVTQIVVVDEAEEKDMEQEEQEEHEEIRVVVVDDDDDVRRTIARRAVRGLIMSPTLKEQHEDVDVDGTADVAVAAPAIHPLSPPLTMLRNDVGVQAILATKEEDLEATDDAGDDRNNNNNNNNNDHHVVKDELVRLRAAHAKLRSRYDAVEAELQDLRNRRAHDNDNDEGKDEDDELEFLRGRVEELEGHHADAVAVIDHLQKTVEALESTVRTPLRDAELRRAHATIAEHEGEIVRLRSMLSVAGATTTTTTTAATTTTTSSECVDEDQRRMMGREVETLD